LSLLFLELSGYYVNAVQLHVHAADVLVRCGIHHAADVLVRCGIHHAADVLVRCGIHMEGFR
jgi:hypothetical protein